MGLLHLIQQHHAVGLAPHRFGEHTPFAIAHVAGRRALEGGNAVGFLVLAHVDRDDVLFAAIQRLGQGQGGLGLAHPGGTREQEHTDGFAGVIEAGAGGLDASRDHLQRVVLADNTLAHALGQAQHVVDFILDHAAHGDPRPVLHHRSHGLFVNAGQHQRMLALQGCQLVLQLAQLRQAVGAIIGFAQLAAQVLNLLHQGPLVNPALFYLIQTLALARQ